MRELISEVLASVYLASPGTALWRWSHDGGALEWPDGTTVVFKAELEEILARLAPEGAPSLSALVLLCGACRDGWREASRQVLATVLAEIEAAKAWAAETRQLEFVLASALAGLDKVSELPPELRRGVDAKTALISVVGDAMPKRLEPDEAACVVDALRDGVRPAEAQLEGAVALAELAPDFRALRSALDRLDAESLERRVRTGIDELLRAAPVELTPSERVRRLLTELRGDPAFAGLARLASDLLAAVHVPRPLLDRDEQPLGGVADISNRGPLDRLLISELAQDDLTFVVRVAMGEALYLRRESTPRRPPARRVVLLDCGIRLWGAPRLFATAVGLALVADAGGDTSVEAFRARREAPVPVDLTTRDGLLVQLEQLEPDPLPVPSLASLCEAAVQEDDPTDLVLVTHRDALESGHMRRALQSWVAAVQLYVATVDAEGGYELWSFSQRGRKRVTRARLDLSKLLHRGPGAELPGARLSVEPVSRSLPRILSLDPFPLRLSCPLRTERASHHPRHGLLATSPDRRLLHWKEPAHGAFELTPSLPSGLTRWLEIDEEGIGRCLRDGVRGPVLVLADLASRKVSRLDLAAPARPQGAFRTRSVLGLVYARHVALFSLATGERLEPVRISSHASWVQGRVFRGADGVLSALVWDGQAGRLEELPRNGLHHGLVLAWERDGHDGFWGLNQSGEVLSLLTEEVAFTSEHLEALLPTVRVTVSRDGQRLLGVDTRARVELEADEVARRRVLVDLAASTERRALGESLALEPSLRPFDRGPQLRKKVQGIGIDQAGRLALVSRRRQVMAVCLDADRQAMRLVSHPEGGSLFSKLRGVTPLDPPRDRGYTLRCATWRDGSRAFVDSRGLLHLQSSREGAPEITIVLTDQGPLGVWLSGDEGGLAGADYFVGEQATVPVTAAFRQIDRFMESLK